MDQPLKPHDYATVDDALRGRGFAAAPQSPPQPDPSTVLNITEIRDMVMKTERDGEIARLTYKEVATLFNVSAQTVMQWVKRGQFMPPVYFGAAARFSLVECRKVLSQGLYPPKTFSPPITARSRIGKLGAAAKADARLAAEEEMRRQIRKITAQEEEKKPKTKPKTKPKPKPTTKKKGK
jgi:SpoVK/Ycf46/Vps4 family AAA+-type ATPase